VNYEVDADETLDFDECNFEEESPDASKIFADDAEEGAQGRSNDECSSDAASVSFGLSEAFSEKRNRKQLPREATFLETLRH
jgi:hypothetical protein